MDTDKNKCVIIEGNVGAGKSTFLKMLGDHLNIQLIEEPHKKWQHLGTGDNLLDKFYKDTKRWAYTFQTYAFVSRVLEQEKCTRSNRGQVQVLERSVFSDRYCFARNCFEMGTMTALEWKLYQEWFEWLVDNYVTKPIGFIYLKTNPKICYERMRKRNRSEEIGVTLEYLTRLHDKHEEWLMEKKDVAQYLRDIPVLVLECNRDFESSRAEVEKHINRIVDFLHVMPGVGAVRNTTTSLGL